MEIPQSDREQYNQNLLYEVVCQLSFPKQLGFPGASLENLQMRLVNDLPILNEIKNQTVSVAQDRVERTISTLYQFSSLDGKKKITICENYVSYADHSYVNWENFLDQVKRIYDIFVEIMPGVGVFTRLGLRYINIISFSEQRFKNESIGNLLKGEVAGLLASSYFQDGTVYAGTINYSINLQDNDNVNLQIGTVVGDNDQIKFDKGLLIDADYFYARHVRKDWENVSSRLGRLNRNSGNVFRWVASDRLRSILRG